MWPGNCLLACASVRSRGVRARVVTVWVARISAARTVTAVEFFGAALRSRTPRAHVRIVKT